MNNLRLNYFLAFFIQEKTHVHIVHALLIKMDFCLTPKGLAMFFMKTAKKNSLP